MPEHQPVTIKPNTDQAVGLHTGRAHREGALESTIVAGQATRDGHVWPNLGHQAFNDGTAVHIDPLAKQHHCAQIWGSQGFAKGAPGHL